MPRYIGTPIKSNPGQGRETEKKPVLDVGIDMHKISWQITMIKD